MGLGRGSVEGAFPNFFFKIAFSYRCILRDLHMQPTISVKDIIIGVIYKPPNTNVETFLSHFIVVLEKLSKENRPSYLLGDYNIDLLKYNHHSESFLNQLLTVGTYMDPQGKLWPTFIFRRNG